MCCFTPITLPLSIFDRVLGRAPRAAAVVVRGTSIFARMVERDRQALVYEMTMATPAPVAMVLPLPVVENDASAVEFVDLSSYPDFFADLSRAFPELGAPKGGFGVLRAQSRQTLAVVRVGAFVASFVPTIADFDRLDARFRMPKHVWDALPRYATWGFAVFQLDAHRGDQKVHPMALRFRTREPGSLFFPTVHVHDGEVHPEAHFHHALFGQGSTFGEPSELPAELVASLDRAHGLVAEGRIRRVVLHGSLPNDDQRYPLDAP